MVQKPRQPPGDGAHHHYTAKENVLGALDDASSKLRGELGESLATVRKFDVPLQQATTSSLEALKAFSLAANADGPSAALPEFHRAIQLDPNFAIGYSAVGNTYHNLKQVARAREYYTRAFLERLIDFDRATGVLWSGRGWFAVSRRTPTLHLRSLFSKSMSCDSQC